MFTFECIGGRKAIVLENRTTDRFNETHAFINKYLNMTCGAFMTISYKEYEGALSMTEEFATTMKAMDDAMTSIGVDRYAGIVLLSRVHMDVLSADEMGAIVMHEYGHIVHGHVRQLLEELVNKNEVLSEMKIGGNPNHELEADAYAATFYGGKTVASAIWKLANSKPVHEFLGKHYEAFNEATHMDILKNAFGYRFDALSKID